MVKEEEGRGLGGRQGGGSGGQRTAFEAEGKA